MGLKSNLILKKAAQGAGNIISVLLRHEYLFRGYNYTFERLPNHLTKALVKFVYLPEQDGIWNIRLINGKKVKTKLYGDNVKTRQFAISYKWHSPSLNFTEFMLSQQADKEACWIDIGANLGLRSLLPLSEQRFVYMVEPNKELNVLNRERCRLNGFSNFKILEIGISNEKKRAEFYVDASSYNSSLHKTAQMLEMLERKETISLDSIDNLFVSLDRAPACMKIDVEGHELQVLNGGTQFIAKWHPPLIVEVNQEGGNFLAFRDYMKKMNYTIYHIKDFGDGKYYRKVNLTGNETDWIIDANDFLAISADATDLHARIAPHCL